MCRCDERLKAKTEETTRLTYTGLCGGLEHLKIETRLMNEMFVKWRHRHDYLSITSVRIRTKDTVCQRSHR
jgi:hypothetical protein